RLLHLNCALHRWADSDWLEQQAERFASANWTIVGVDYEECDAVCELIGYFAPQTLLVTDLVNDVKVSSASLIEKEDLFPGFVRWQDEYWAFTCSYKDRNAVSKYIERQPTHHRDITFAEELEAMSKAEGVGRGRKLK
ncbi:MAG: transposase, partial [Candidatus Hydrogenedentota bacterium]